jgi:peptidyl-prolyl cis-trans isomerase SurA
MKKFCMLFAMALATVHAQSQTLITYGSHTVSKDEFLRAYNKNKTPVTDNEKAIRDYIELYSNFKMKVKAAESMRLDTSAQLQTDLDNFRRQIEENYMNDEKSVNALMDEAFNRSQSDIHVIHFSIAVDTGAQPADTLNAYKAIQAAYSQLQSGNTRYASISSATGTKWSDLGFVTVFSLPYQYENIAYGLKPGETSMPYRSKKAWHIFQVVEKRKSAGKWRIAQILFSLPPDADNAARASAQKLADSVYQLIQNGDDFGEAARIYSEDKLTYLTAGEMPEFGSGKFDYSFEKEVLRLNKDGDISKPFTTSFGIHIIKRLEHTTTPTDKEDAAFQYELKQKLMQDDRVKSAKEKFAKDITGKIGYKPVASIKEADLYRFADSIMADPMGEIASKLPISDKAVINFAKGSAKGVDWLNFVRDYKTNPEQYKGESNAALWEKFKTKAALDYYRRHLDEYNSEFRYQLQEFKEGNMLFEVMEKKVWSQASADSIGLLAYYNAHKENYKWAASADVLIMNAVSEKVATDAMNALREGKNWKELVEMKQGELQGDSGRFELSQVNGTASAAPGSYSPVTKNPDGTATFIKYFRFYEPGQQRSFDDSRGMVINDYQAVLEKKWLDELKKKYPVKVNEALVKTLIR